MFRNALIGAAVIAGLCSIAPAQPTTQPAEKDLPLMPENAIIRLPDGRELNLADLQRDGNAVVMVHASGMSGGSTIQAVDEDGRRISITENDEEVVVSVKDGDDDPVEYRAADVAELEEKHPEAYELYEKFAMHELPAFAVGGGGGAGVIQQRIALNLNETNTHKIESLGCTAMPITDRFVLAQLGKGVEVILVEEESLAANLGLKQHDLIRKVNAKDVATLEEIEDALDQSTEVELEILRAGKELKLSNK